MKLAFRTDGVLTFNKMKDGLKTLCRPALLADEGKRICERIGENDIGLHCRIGTRLDSLFNSHDSERLDSLQLGEVFIAELKGGSGICYALVVRGEGGYLVFPQSLCDRFSQRLLERCEELSGYDVGPKALLSEMMLNADRNGRAFAVASAAEWVINELSEVHKLPFFDFSAAITRLICAIGEASRSACAAISFPKILPEAVAVGSGNDFVLVLALLLSVCLGDFKFSGAHLSVHECDDGLCLTVRADMQNALAETLFDSFGKERSDASLYALFIRLIADCNFWDIDLRHTDGHIEFTLTVPSVARGEEFYVRDDERDMSVLLRALFCGNGQ